MMDCKILVVLCDDLYEELELFYPYFRLMEEGYPVVLAGEEIREYKSKYGYPATPTTAVKGIASKGVGGVIIPGGFAPDRLRRNPSVLQLVQEVFLQGGLIAAICHGPWVMISAGILKDKDATCFMAIKDDLVNAGAKYIDEPVVVHGNIITSRTPMDLPYFLPAIIEFLKEQG